MKKDETPIHSSVRFVDIEDELAGQRIDNFLRTFLKGVPKSLIYRIIRKGEVRVNKKRIKPDYKLAGGDLVRVPPVKVSESNSELPSSKLNSVQRIESSIIYEDDCLIVLNKPSGLAVHGGSGLSFGLIEALRALRPTAKFLELVHRLDRDTSGCILVAKKRSALKHLHEQLRLKTVDKRYHALVMGQWPEARHKVKASLFKNTLQSGERIVVVSADGKPSETRYRVLQRFQDASLVEAFPVTGRTHQIRVHCLHAGHPIAKDDKYGVKEFDAAVQKNGLNRLFLHAYSIRFEHPVSGDSISFVAPLEPQLKKCLKVMSEKMF